MTRRPENLDPHLQRHLALCKRMYLRLLTDGTWPWPEAADSPDPEDVVESGDNPHDI